MPLFYDKPISEAQRRAMGAAMSGHSNLGIPKSVGAEFIEKDPGGKLPETSGDQNVAPGESGYPKPGERQVPGPGAMLTPPVQASRYDKPFEHLSSTDMNVGKMAQTAAETIAEHRGDSMPENSPKPPETKSSPQGKGQEPFQYLQPRDNYSRDESASAPEYKQVNNESLSDLNKKNQKYWNKNMGFEDCEPSPLPSDYPIGPHWPGR